MITYIAVYIVLKRTVKYKITYCTLRECKMLKLSKYMLRHVSN